MARRAAFDLGSGATKLSVADVNFQEGSLPLAKEVVLSRKVDILLTEDLERNNETSTFSEAILDVVEATLCQFKAEAEAQGTEQYAGVATAAFRKAKNGQQFLDRIFNKLGIRFYIISQVSCLDLLLLSEAFPSCPLPPNPPPPFCFCLPYSRSHTLAHTHTCSRVYTTV